jgi:lysophospholipase L1-like esterase
MKYSINQIIALTLLVISSTQSITIAQEIPPTVVNEATIPVRRKGMKGRHESYNAIAQKGGVELLFIGDSITEGWSKEGAAIWDERYMPLKACNFGIAGETIQNILWRLQNGNLDGIQPKLIVLMAGTNNIPFKNLTPEDIAKGVAAVVQEIRTRTPNSKLLLIGVFPRREQPTDPYRKKITQLNNIISGLDDGRHVFYLDVGQHFLSSDAKISTEIMPDFLHLTTAGYKIWADAMQPKIIELMK